MSRRPRPSARQSQVVRETRRVIRVIAEGTVTEPDYLARYAQEHRDRIRVSIDPAPKWSDPVSLVRETRRQKQMRSSRDPEFDEFWCVFDVDAHDDVNRAVAEARDAGIETAVSNPCFELWLVLHIESQTAHVDRDTIQRRARGLGLLDGKSIPESAWPTLLDGYDDAKRRARKLDTRHLGVSPPGSNPSSGVWRLIDTIRGGQLPALTTGSDPPRVGSSPST